MKQFLYILFLAAVTAGCSDNQATVGEESETTVNNEKSANGPQLKTTERVNDEVDVDTIGMAEFLALKATVASKYREGKDLPDEDDVDDDTTGFTAFKRSKAKLARRPCDCEDSLKAEGKNNSRNAKTSASEKATEQSESTEESESSDQLDVAEDSTPVSRNQQLQRK